MQIIFFCRAFKISTNIQSIKNVCLEQSSPNKYIVLAYQKTYFVKDHTDVQTKYSEVDVISILDFLIDNIYVELSGLIFQQTDGIPMGTNCAPLLADLFLYAYEAEFIQGLLKAGTKRLEQQFNFTYRYMDNVLSLNNSKISEFIDVIYPSELDSKDPIESSISPSYLDCYLNIDNVKLITRG